MASGQSVAIIYQVTPTAANYATMDTRLGGSTPGENVPVWDFDGTTAEYVDFYCQMLSNYSGGGITLQIKFSMTSAINTTGNVVWRAAFRRIADDAEDVDTAQTYDFNSVTATPTTAAGEVKYTSITFTNGADMDSVTAGDMFILRFGRDPVNVADTVSTDAELHYIVITET
jgi:hypothetical protein